MGVYIYTFTPSTGEAEEGESLCLVSLVYILPSKIARETIFKTPQKGKFFPLP